MFTIVSYIFSFENSNKSCRKFGTAFCFAICAFLALIFSSPSYALTAEEELQRRFYESSEVEYSLSNSPFYLESSSTVYQYEGFEGTESVNTFDGTAYFIELLKEANIDAFPNATWIPISGDITFFIPSTGILPKRVGTPYVEKGLIKAQITKLLQRSWIGGYATVESQAKALAEHGVAYGIDKGLSFGQNLSIDEIQDVAQDMVWPELRNIHGEDVLVPVVYLSQRTYTDQVIDGNTLSFGNADLNYETVSIDGAKVETLRSLMVDVTDSFINQNGTIVAGEVDITAGQDITNLSGIISGDTVRLAANNIENRTLVIRHNYDYGYNEYADTLAVIESVGDLTINTTTDYLDSGGNLLNQGAQIIAGGFLDVEAQGNIQIVSQPVSDYHSQSGSFWSETTSSVQNLRSQLSGSDITLFAHQALVIEGALIESPGMVELLANMGLYIVESIDSETYQYTFEIEGGGFSADISETEERERTEILQAIIKAGKDVSIRSNGTALNTFGELIQGDVVLRAIDLEAEGDVSIIAQNGAIHFDVAKDLDYYSYEYNIEGLLTFEMSGEGHKIETGYYNKLVNQGIFLVSETEGFFVDYVIPPAGDGDEQSMDQILDVVAANDGFDWLNQIRCTNVEASDCAYEDVNWSVVDTAFDEWDYHSQGLTEAGAALVAVAVSVATGGAGTNIVAAFSSSASASIAAGTALTATQLTTAAVLQAAVTTVTNQATNALFATGFDLGETFEVLGSSENIKSLASSMITAGTLSYLGDLFLPEIQGVSLVDLDLTQQIQQGILNATTKSLISTTIYGGGWDTFIAQLETNSRASIVNTLGAELTNFISGETDVGSAARYIAQAASGCIVGVASANAVSDSNSEVNSDSICLSSAGGAIVAEYIAHEEFLEQAAKNEESVIEWLARHGLTDSSNLESNISDMSREEYGAFLADQPQILVSEIQQLESDGVKLAQLGAGLLAFALGGDVSAASEAASITGNYSAFYNLTSALNSVNVINEYIDIKKYIDLSETIKLANGQPEQIQDLVMEFVEEYQIESLLGLPYSQVITEIVKYLNLTNTGLQIVDIFNSVSIGNLSLSTPVLTGIEAVEALFEESFPLYESILESSDPTILAEVAPWVYSLAGGEIEPSVIWEAYQNLRPFILDEDALEVVDRVVGSFFGSASAALSFGETIAGSLYSSEDILHLVLFQITPDASLVDGKDRALESFSNIYNFLLNLEDIPGIVIDDFNQAREEILDLEARGEYVLASRLQTEFVINTLSGLYGVSAVAKFASDGKLLDLDLEGKYQVYVKRKESAGKEARDRAEWIEVRNYWLYDSPIARGNAFNDFVNTNPLYSYPYNEVTLVNEKRVDGYDPVLGEIVSRKATDLDDILPATFVTYLREMHIKYAPGTKIKAPKYGDKLKGMELKGRLILEVPDSNLSSPNIQAYIDIAQSYDIELRFTPEN